MHSSFSRCMFAKRWSSLVLWHFVGSHLISWPFGESVCWVESWSAAMEHSHGSVTHHRTLGSHDSLLIWGIVWSLLIIKTNHRPMAQRLSVCLSVCLLASSLLCPTKVLSACVPVHLSDFQSYLSCCARLSTLLNCLSLLVLLSFTPVAVLKGFKNSDSSAIIFSKLIMDVIFDQDICKIKCRHGICDISLCLLMGSSEAWSWGFISVTCGNNGGWMCFLHPNTYTHPSFDP